MYYSSNLNSFLHVSIFNVVMIFLHFNDIWGHKGTIFLRIVYLCTTMNFLINKYNFAHRVSVRNIEYRCL